MKFPVVSRQRRQALWAPWLQPWPWVSLVLLLLSLIGAELALLLWLHDALAWSWIHGALALASLNLVLAGIFLRLGGSLTQGPYLPETTAGITKTTKALLGR